MKHNVHRLTDPHRLSLTRAGAGYRRHKATGIGILGAMAWLFIAMSPLPGFTEDDFLLYQRFVKYDDDNVSLALSNVRASDAAQLMRSATGVMINLPTSTQSRTVNLTLEHTKMDQAIHSLLTALELNNSFLVYDREGRLTGVIALEKGTPRIQNANQFSDEKKRKKEYKELTAPEREALVREFRLWSKLPVEDRESIHARLKTIPPSKERDELVNEYVHLVLGVSEPAPKTED